ncbi:MAG: hypothetical protein JWQ27_249 [Ferruginibacter sp.]|nr:hypothetical protein [Ferruginibacter sp.]
MSQTNSIPSANSHPITLTTAISMTQKFRANRETILDATYKGLDILPLNETFNRDAFDALLATDGAEAIRLYYGMTEDLDIHAIFVAVNADNEDLLPPATPSESETAQPVIMQTGQRCPTTCPPDSDLN